MLGPWGEDLERLEKMNSRKRLTKAVAAIIAAAAVLLLLMGAYLGTVEAATAPSLGSADSFAVLAGSTVTNTGATIVNGNLGVSPLTAVTGFPPGVVVPPGTIHAGDALAGQAQSSLTTAYNNLAGQPCNIDLTGQDLGGLTLTSGVYCFPNTSAQLTGPLTLDAQNNANAVFVFKIGSTLTTASSSSVKIINGGNGCKVFWQVGSSATLGTATAFKGNILAQASITLGTSANISPGRALARTAAVTMDTNSVTMAPCVAATPAPSTKTSVAATLTAIAPTLTAVAATQTAVAPPPPPPATPTKTLAAPDINPPTGKLTATGTDGLGNSFIKITAKDIGSGVASIVVIKSVNAATLVAAFIPGTLNPVIITSTKINPGQGSSVELKITDVAGNVTFADPVLTRLALDGGKQITQTFKNIPPQEHFITITNGAPGLKRMVIRVNGTEFKVKKLKAGVVKSLNVASAMTKSSNRIRLIGFGKAGASAFIVIGDSVLEQPEAMQGFQRAQEQRPGNNFTWGDVDNSE